MSSPRLDRDGVVRALTSLKGWLIEPAPDEERRAAPPPAQTPSVPARPRFVPPAPPVRPAPPVAPLAPPSPSRSSAPPRPAPRPQPPRAPAPRRRELDLGEWLFPPQRPPRPAPEPLGSPRAPFPIAIPRGKEPSPACSRAEPRTALHTAPTAPAPGPATLGPPAEDPAPAAVESAPPALGPFDDALEEARRSAPTTPSPPILRRVVVGVVGLVPGAGASTCAALLAAELGTRDPAGAALLLGGRARLHGGWSRPAKELAGRLAPLGLAPVGGAGRVVELADVEEEGSLEILRMLAPCVLAPTAAGTERPLEADRTVIVAGRGVEPALAGVAAASLVSAGAHPVLAVNRATEPGAWQGRAAALLPERRLAVRSAGLGRPAPGALGAAVRGLADLLDEDPRR